MKKILFTRVAILLVVFSMLAAMLIPVSAEENLRETDVLYEKFDSMNNEDEFSTDKQREYVPQISYAAGKMQVTDQSMKVNTCDFRTWYTQFSEKYMYFEIDVLLDNNYVDTTLNLCVQNQSAATGPLAPGGRVVSVKKTESGVGLFDNKDNLLMELNKNNTWYKISVEMKKGDQIYSVYVNDQLISDNCEFYSPMYRCDGISLDGSSSGNSYITIDNFRVRTKGRAYPQEYSYDSVGDIPKMSVNEYIEKNEIDFWVNGEKKECDTPFVLENNTMYFSYEWLKEAMGDDGKSYYLSKKNSTI